MKIGEIIRELRFDKEMSQKALAKEIDSIQASVQKWESGERRPMIDAVAVLVLYFGVSTDCLLGLED